ncbi:Metalloreductase STEAP3 [Wickerhamomyces ciferrii]|uniref:Metalloreductase STEAP3 n=1 Tax=Wickerhamomyces ciferrii (strain ATCC 14091 / BCRC 22168 / CBS 111 / JCM 3599 / NBRC 0793 / NRRL Y-1031 F-60-10) TaxID=1206466 RepID=K0KM27_WICCF|nr:Metalloreductase STEAP3 [Wickerhamomyces ciferrii]CCH42424.1 Metalloreductase STEAP3 [Wickerhamomyces ciferrii]
MVQTIGFIGVGQIGGGVAKLAVNAGYDVVLSNSRGPESLADVVNDLGPKSDSKTFKEIANDENIDIVVLSIPLKAIEDLLPSSGLKNKLILDTTNYYADRDGNVAVLDNKKLLTSEYVAKFLDKSNKLVKVFNNIGAIHLRSAATKDPNSQTTLPIAGDDSNAKDQTTNFLNNIGYQALDVGKLEDSWKFEPNTPAYGWPYIPKVPKDLNEEDQKKYYITHVAEPVSKDQLKKIIDSVSFEDHKPSGSFDDYPKFVGDALVEMYREAEKIKAANSSIVF